MCQSGKTAFSLALLSVLLLQVPVYGQSYWTDQSNGQSFALEFMKPQFSEDEHTDFFTSVTYLSGRFQVSDQMTVELELPIARYAANSDYYDVSETVLGNPYIGARVESNAFVTRFGLRLPTASSDEGALLVGLVTDYDRFEAFLEDVATVYTSFAPRISAGDNLEIQAGGGPLAAILTKDTGGDQAEIFMHYFLFASSDQGPVTISGGFTGRAIVTEGDLSFAERSVHHIGLGVSASRGRFRPGLHIRLPLDDDINLDYALGLNLSVLVN